MARSVRVIIDTNIFFSSIFYPEGNERKLFELADRGYVEIIVFDYVLDEIQAILQKKGIESGLVIDLLDTYRNIVFMELDVKDYQRFEEEATEVIRDRKDLPVYIFARTMIEKDRDVYLVTGDNDFYVDAVKKSLNNRVLRTKDLLKRLL